MLTPRGPVTVDVKNTDHWHMGPVSPRPRYPVGVMAQGDEALDAITAICEAEELNVTGLEDADLVAFAVNSKCRFSGCTVFRVLPDSTSLAGLPSLWPVAAQEMVKLEPDETTESLRAK